MSRSTITLPNDLLEELMRSVNAKSKTEAVLMAIKDEIRLKKLEKIRSMAGIMEFTQTAEEIRHGDERLG
jgi:metal-responsive CopG/Arc/MetJ family transcriptional regulator